jgi:hypothetical protein
MKSLKWAATLGVVAVCVILFLNRDDVVRYQKMRQMSWSPAGRRPEAAVGGARKQDGDRLAWRTGRAIGVA